MTTADYLIEMKIAPTGTILSPREGIAFTERYVLPTLDACRELTAAGTIVAGGPAIAAMTFTFVLRARSPEHVEEIVSGLPIWPRAQTTIVPLGTFEHRAANVRQRLAKVKDALAQAPVAAASPDSDAINPVVLSAP
jgi:hypothetical protein